MSTLTFLGCGTLGTAILSGILDALSSGDASPPPNCPTTFTACVRRAVSADRIRDSLPKTSHTVKLLAGDNVAGVKAADIILLGCKPYMCSGVLMADGMKEALEGKVLISICAGVKVDQLREMCPESTRVIRVMPNTAAKVGGNGGKGKERRLTNA